MMHVVDVVMLVSAAASREPLTMFSFEWWRQFYLLNVDTFLSAGWFVLGLLTVIASVDMFVQAFFKNYNLEP